MFITKLALVYTCILHSHLIKYRQLRVWIGYTADVIQSCASNGEVCQLQAKTVREDLGPH